MSNIPMRISLKEGGVPKSIRRIFCSFTSSSNNGMNDVQEFISTGFRQIIKPAVESKIIGS